MKKIKKTESDFKKIEKHIAQGVDKAKQIASDVHARYEALDPATKKKIKAGIAGLGALLAAGAVYGKHKHKKSKKSK